MAGAVFFATCRAAHSAASETQAPSQHRQEMGSAKPGTSTRAVEGIFRVL